LEKAKAEAKKFRLEKEALEQQINETSARASQVQATLLNEKVQKHLTSLGIQHGDRLSKYIKMDQLSLNEDFEVNGLEEQVESLKIDFPELFDPKFIVAGKADAAVTTAVELPKTASDLQARLILKQ
jgi:hypothetical protein